jgi:hypothetical protein
MKRLTLNIRSPKSGRKNPRKKASPRIVWMAPSLGVSTLAVLLILFFTAGPSRGQVTTTATNSLANLLQIGLTIFNTIPEPPDALLLDASGNVVLDASGNPVSDPNEGFHAVIPQDFDPGHTNLVEAKWLDGLGCVTSGFVATANASFTGVAGTMPYHDLGCPSGDPKDMKNEGFLLVKTGPSVANFASAGAELKKVRGITMLTELGFDIRKSGVSGTSDNQPPLGSHCGAGAPRFNILTTTNFYFLGCASPPAVVTTGPGSAEATPPPPPDWLRLRWSGSPVMAFCATCPFPTTFTLQPITGTVLRIQIVFDEGSDTGGDFFGAAIIDNVDVNATLVGRGPDEG